MLSIAGIMAGVIGTLIFAMIMAGVAAIIRLKRHGGVFGKKILSNEDEEFARVQPWLATQALPHEEFSDRNNPQTLETGIPDLPRIPQPATLDFNSRGDISEPSPPPPPYYPQ